MAGRACGKVILLGEHAVVFGKPALAIGIDKGASARAAWSAGGVSRLFFDDTPTPASSEDPALSRALGALLDACKLDRALELQVTSELPRGAGLGSSAAIAVACVRALDELNQTASTHEDTVRRVNAWEGVFHGSPSGIDVAAASLGGALLFRRASHEVELQQLVVPVDFAVAVAHSGATSSTRVMIERVRALRTSSPRLVERIFDRIGELVHLAAPLLQAGESCELGRLLTENQVLLRELEVSTPSLDRLCEIATRANAWGAKLTGSGGGGCAIALAEEPEKVVQAWRGAGFSAFLARVGRPWERSTIDG